MSDPNGSNEAPHGANAQPDPPQAPPQPTPKEIGGRGGLDPVRYGDWEKAGRCIDF